MLSEQKLSEYGWHEVGWTRSKSKENVKKTDIYIVQLHEKNTNINYSSLFYG